ncbi:MAG TPA: 4Fe-4S binding protein, partial [Anaerolineales bacterium]|nr:4Fe-4S binding protein [Anaerolineales bacterium]
LTRLPLVKPLLKSRWPQWMVQVAALAGFVFAITAGLIGTPVGNHNFSIVFVWIGWWALLMLIAVPLFGRGWCSICPIPLPGEWLQRGAVIAPNAQGGFTLGRRWPNRLRNIWLQNGTFALTALFSAVVLTQPGVTAIVLAAFLFLALAASLVFERRAFCRYLCPVGGFIGLYSQVAPVEVRAKDPSLCATHLEKTCYVGGAEGYGCPWQVYPGGLVKNTYCGTCVECLRTCPHDNIAINLRPPGADLLVPAGRKLDEAFKAFIMLGSALAYSLVMLGPWGAIKTAAYSVGSAAWIGYALSFVVWIFGMLPGAFLIAVLVGKLLGKRAPVSTRKAFTSLSYALIPLGLAAWIAFSLSFVFANLSYLWPVVSDPLGWGWNLFGTAGIEWTPYFMQIVPASQVIVLIGGLVWASLTARQIAGELKFKTIQAAPVVVFCFGVTVGLLWLLVG